ncbi:DUF1493 family protein [Flavobacterium sp. GB2R13]|uniref:DUF1493 family protein n=1 Tax=Flavobacterium algoris TaxID=3398733 RepID=UPI003A8ACDD5
MDELEKKVIDFFNKNNIVKNNKIDSSINKPNYFADEAFFLMEEFFVKFNIDKGYIDIDKFFNPLPTLSFKHFLNLFGLKKMEYPEKPKITIGHMIEVAKRKEWFDPI